MTFETDVIMLARRGTIDARDMALCLALDSRVITGISTGDVTLDRVVSSRGAC